MSKVFVKYGFVFDPDETWTELSDFERDLAVTFKKKGLKAELIETVDEQEGMIIIYISKSEEVFNEEEPVEFDKKELNG